MNQRKNINLLKDILTKKCNQNNIAVRFIKIGGSNFQENGLPDIIVLLRNINNYKSARLWFEVKRNNDDVPSKLQIINILSLKDYGFITGFVVGENFKSTWDGKEYSLEYIIDKIIKTQL